MASSIIPGTEGSPRKRWKIYTLSRDSHNSPGLQISRKILGSMYFALCNCNRAWSNEVIANAPQCGGPQSRRNTMKIRIIQTSLPLPGSRFTLKVLWNAQKTRVGGIVSWCSINGKGCRVEWKKNQRVLLNSFYRVLCLDNCYLKRKGFEWRSIFSARVFATSFRASSIISSVVRREYQWYNRGTVSRRIK